MYIGLANYTWTSGWLPGVAGALVILILSRPRLGIFSGLLAGGVFIFANGQASQFIMQGDNEYSLMTRIDAWQILGKMLATSPILGFGPANYYWYTPLFPIRGYSVVFNSHNNYMDLLAQVGIIGLVCFLWFAGALGWLGWQLRSRLPEGFQKAYVIGALGGLAGTLAAMMLGDWVIPFVYNVGFTGFRASLLGWMFLGGMVAIYFMNQHIEEVRNA
jgi:O-antigen ligase